MICIDKKDSSDCSMELWTSIVKVEPQNMIWHCRNLQLQIVWNWLGVPVLFGRLTAIGAIYLLKTTKVSSNTERSWTVIFFLYFSPFFCVSSCQFVEVSEARMQAGDSFRDFRVLFLVLWRWTKRLFLKGTHIPSH